MGRLPYSDIVLVLSVTDRRTGYPADKGEGEGEFLTVVLRVVREKDMMLELAQEESGVHEREDRCRFMPCRVRLERRLRYFSERKS